MTKKKDKISTSKEFHNLKVDLTGEELLQAGEELANAIDEVNKLEDEKKAMNDELKARVAVHEATIAVKQRLIRNKDEYRNVECELTLNYTTQKAQLVRLDTVEIFTERDMTMEFDGEGKDVA